MRLHWFVLCGMLLTAASVAAQEPRAAHDSDAKPFTPAQERAAAEARARQARLRLRHEAGVSITRPTYYLSRMPQLDPSVYKVDPGIPRRRVDAPWLR
uniref:Uncharacterized protein n=1 Tax=Schlesneria paludicola TaxID=360056 RepID=A0A7C2P4P8_9PLAN